LSKWCKEFGEQREVAFPGKGHQTPFEEENKRLQCKKEILRQKSDRLKKQQEIS
jgi:transposase-like protein